MSNFLKRIKMDAIISAAACITFGIVLILWPVRFTTIVCQTIAVVIAVLGAVRVISYVMHAEEKNRLDLPLGLILFMIGIWIFLKPQSIQSLLLIGIGVVLFVHGLESFRYAMEAKRGGYEPWWTMMVMALLGMGLGAVCVFDCFGVLSMTFMLVGVALVYDGISLLWVISRVHKTTRAVRRSMEDLEAIETEAVEKDEPW